MNLLDAIVTEVIGEPELKYGKWFIKVNANCWGIITESTLMFSSKEVALSVKPGYIFQC